jgi:hypothetical protein
MTIAELFVEIGVKGAEKAISGLGKIKDGVAGIAESSLAANAALAGIIYGLQRMTLMSADTGMELQRFGNLTGLSTDSLQRWQFALRQSGVSAEETAGSIKGVQSAIADMQLGKGPPGGIGIIAQYTGGFDKNQINDTFYVMDKLKQFAQNKAVPTAFGNNFLKSFGLSENAIQGLRSMTTDLNKVKPSYIYTPAEIARLAKIQVAWDNLFAEIKMFGVRLGGSFGPKVVQGLQDAFHEAVKLSKLFSGLKVIAVTAAIAISAAFAPLTAVIAGIVFALSELKKYQDGKTTVTGAFLKDAKESLSHSDSLGGKETDKDRLKRREGLFSGIKNFFFPASQPAPRMKPLTLVAPPRMKSQQFGSNQSNVINLNQNISHVGDAADTHNVGGAYKKSLQRAAGTNQALKQVN